MIRVFKNRSSVLKTGLFSPAAKIALELLMEAVDRYDYDIIERNVVTGTYCFRDETGEICVFLRDNVFQLSSSGFKCIQVKSESYVAKNLKRAFKQIKTKNYNVRCIMDNWLEEAEKQSKAFNRLIGIPLDPMKTFAYKVIYDDLVGKYISNDINGVHLCRSSLEKLEKL